MGSKGKWVEELSHVLWTYQTTLYRLMREIPFSMTYGVEAIIPLEIGFPMLRTSLFTPYSNDNLLEQSLDLIEERRENAMVQLAYYQQKLNKGMTKYKVKTIGPWGLSVEKGCGHCKKSSMGKVMAQLGKTIPYHFGSWYRCILPRRSRRKCCTATLECK